MTLKSTLTKIHWPENKEFNYSLSGIGGSGNLSLAFGTTDNETYLIHVKATAKIPFLNEFHFEGLALWEKAESGFDFVSYEERDFSKNIHKKWEMLADGLNYIENKKGLVLEREVQYFNAEEHSVIFDPISAATVALIENSDRNINIFGKQRILHLKTFKENNELKIETMDGLSATWTKILSNAHILLDEINVIKEIEIPSPIQIGKIKMKFISENPIDSEHIDFLVKNFKK